MMPTNNESLQVVVQRVSDMIGGQTMIISGANNVLSICWKKHVSDLVEVQVIRKFKSLELDNADPERIALAFVATVKSAL